MFKLQHLAFICLALLALEEVSGYSYQYLGNAVHPTLADHCFHPEYNLTVAVNETVFPTNIKEKCIKVFCREDFVLEMKHCERPAASCSEGVSDYSKPYPDCCPVRDCKQTY